MSTQQELLKEKPQLAQQIDTLYHVDIRMDNLKSFLSNIGNVINQQSIVINQMQIDLKTKAQTEKVELAFKQISKAIELNDTELHKKVAVLLDKPKSESTGDLIIDSSNMVCNKIVYLGQACSLIYKGNKDWERKLNIVEGELPKKVGIDAVKDQVGKTKNKLINDIEQFKISSYKQIDDQGKKFQYEVSRFEQLVKESEKKTVWKINDCETLLQKRVTTDYVNSTAKSLEDKLKKEILKMKEESFGDIQHQLNLLNDKFKNLDECQQEKQKNIKKQIKDLEDQLSLKFCSNDKYETYKKSVLDKISELENKLVIIDRKGNANEVNESLIKALKDLDEKLYALYREDGKLKNEIQDLLVKIELQGKALEKGEQQEQNNNISDPHRICALESDSKQLMYDISEFKRIVSNLDSEIRRKFDALEHKVLSQFNNIKKKDQANFSREEIIGMIERGKIFAEEKLKVIESDLVDMKGKIGLISDLDKKLKRKFRELQDNTDWSKKLEEKANNDETKKEFLHIDEKIKNINALVSQFRKEFETIEEFYLQLASLLKNNQQETVALITGNTRIIPNRCVACGTKGRQNFNTSDVRGTDGKIYKADFGSQNQTSVYEQQEVFDVLPSEIGLPNIYVNEEKQNKFVQFKGRPDSAKTDIQSVSHNLQNSFVSNKSGRKF